MPPSELAFLHKCAGTDLEHCGSAVIASFRKALSTCSQELASLLIDLANEKMLSYHYRDVPLNWRQLHTDATLVLSYCEPGNSVWQATDLLSIIKCLDMALIVSGSPGLGRRDLLFHRMHQLQQRLITEPRSSSSPSSIRMAIMTRELGMDSAGLQSITRLSHAELATLTSLSQPVIVQQAISHWPAVEKWGDLSYIQELAGPGRVVPVEVGANYIKATWSQAIVPFDHFLERLHAGPTATDQPLYLAQHDLFAQLPKLNQDILVPDQVFTLVPEEPNYLQPQTETGLIVNAWLGPPGTISPAHTDPYCNAYAQVVGRKSVWVAPPQADLKQAAFSEAEGSGGASLMDNTAHVDVFDTSHKTLQSRLLGRQAVLYPGDLLLMPPGWWHAIKSLDVAFSVSIWF